MSEFLKIWKEKAELIGHIITGRKNTKTHGVSSVNRPQTPIARRSVLRNPADVFSAETQKEALAERLKLKEDGQKFMAKLEQQSGVTRDPGAPGSRQRKP